MATQTVDSHQTSTSDEQTVKFSEAVKVTEQINVSSPQETIEDDGEKGKADNLHILDNTLSTSEEKAVDIQVEPPVIEVKKTDEAPVVELPVHDNEKLEKESSFVAEVATVVADETVHEESPSTKPVGEEAAELPVIAFLEKTIKEFDAADNVKSPPEEQATAEVIEREALENVSVLVEEVEEKKPKIIDNPELPVVVEKALDKEPEIVVQEESVEPAKKEAQQIEVVPVEEEPTKVVAKEIIETVEHPPEKEQPVEVHPIKELEEVIAKEISERIEVPEEKKQASEDEPAQESREVIETKISEPVEVPQESELLVEVHPANEPVVIEKETNESIEPLKNEEHSDEVISHNKSVEVIGNEVSESSEPLKNNEEAGEGFSVTESGEVKEKETSDCTLDSKESENKKEEVIEVKDGIEELPEITKLVQDTNNEAELVKDEKPLAPRDDIGPPTEEIIQEEEGSDKQESVDQVAESGPIEDSVKGLEEKEQPATEVVSVEKEPKKEPDTTFAQEESIEPPKKEPQAIEAVTLKELPEVVAKEVIETVEPPAEKEQPVVTPKEVHEVVTEEVTETVEPPIEKEQPVKIAKEISEVVAEKDTITVEPPTENKQPVLIAKEISEVVAEEVAETVEPPTENEQPVVIAKETSEVIAKEVTETVEPPTQKEQTVVITEETSESIEPPKNEKQPDEVISHRESVEFIAPEVNAFFDPPKNNEQADGGFPVAEPSKKLEEEGPAKEFVSVNNEPREEPETSPVLDLSLEPPKKEEQTIEVHTVEEQVEVITREIIDRTELPKEMEEIDVHPVQESMEVTTEKISETVDISQENELLTEVHPVKELKVIAEGTSEFIESPNNKKQSDEVLSQKESLETIEKEARASFDPPKIKEQADEDFSVTESGEMKGKETTDSMVGSEEVVKLEPEVTEVEENVTELPELTKHVQDTYVEVENVQDGKALAQKDDISPPIEGGETQEEEAQYAAESDKQGSVNHVAKSDVIEDTGKGIEKEQPTTELVSVGKESKKEPETTCVPVEVLPAVKVIEKEILEGFELLTEKEQPTGVHSLQGSYDVVEKEIREPTELPTEVQPLQESKEVIAEKIDESLEIPKEGGLLIEEVQPLKELEVVAEATSGSIEPPKYQEQLKEVPLVKESVVIAKDFPVAESEGVGAKEASGSKLSPKEVEKRELEVTEVKDGKEELPEITDLVCNDYVKVETEAIENGGTMEGEKSSPPLEVEQIHKEEQCTTVESDKQDSPDQEDQHGVELAEDERKESSNIDGVAKLSVVEKLGEENEEKMEKIQELTQPRYFETDAVVVEKSTDDQKAGELADLIAETKIEVETSNADVHESELEVKDKEVGITGGGVPKVNDKKVPSKQSHKHSHNLLSKVKQSLVKAKKAIIGKSPSSKTLSSEAKDDIKVK